MSSRFTPLESDILDALAWDLRDIAPDLAGQVAESLPGSRRNTGSGLFTELILDRDRPPPLTSPTGCFGTVHAMVGDLPDPIAFQVELRQGRLLALHGDAYDQDTRALDFARAPYDEVFTVDERGESIAFDPAALMQPSPLLDLQQHDDHEPPHPVASHSGHPGAGQGLRNSASRELMNVLFGPARVGTLVPVAEADASPPNAADQTSLLVGASVAIAVGAVFVTLIFRLPWVFGLFLAIGVGRLVQKPNVLSALSRMTRSLGRYEYRPPDR